MNLANDPLITLHLKLEQFRLEIKHPLLLKPSHIDSKLTYLVKTVSRVSIHTANRFNQIGEF